MEDCTWEFLEAQPEKRDRMKAKEGDDFHSSPVVWQISGPRGGMPSAVSGSLGGCFQSHRVPIALDRWMGLDPDWRDLIDRDH